VILFVNKKKKADEKSLRQTNNTDKSEEL